jgi:hypothetical protein
MSTINLLPFKMIFMILVTFWGQDVMLLDPMSIHKTL